jgi:hypothetical protein
MRNVDSFNGVLLYWRSPEAEAQKNKPMSKINESELKTFVVYEGEAYLLEYLAGLAAKYCTQDNWLSDWIFVGAKSSEDAVKVAAVVDDFGSKRQGRIYTKLDNIRENWQSPLLGEEAMGPTQIMAGTKEQNQSTLVFRQGWVTI